MARSRDLKPGFFKNEALAECQPLARILFAGLWTIADREGRLEDRPRRIRAEVLPYDDVDADTLLGELADRGFIERYEVDGQPLIQVVNFQKHQHPHPREAASVFPPPPNQATPRPDPGSTLALSSPAGSSSYQDLPLLPATDAAADGWLASVRGALGVHFGKGRPLGIGRDRARVEAELRRWVEAVGEAGLVAECKRLAAERGAEPDHLAWFVGWLATVSDTDLAAARQRRGAACA